MNEGILNRIFARAAAIIGGSGGTIDRRAALRRAAAEAGVEKIKSAPPRVADGEAASAKEVFFEKIMRMHRAMKAVEARPPAKVQAAATAPVQPPPAGQPHPAMAAQAHPPAPVEAAPLDPEREALRRTYMNQVYVGGRSGGSNINDEFYESAATAGWRASLNRPAPDYGPPIDVSENNIVRLWEEQERRRKMEQSS